MRLCGPNLPIMGICQRAELRSFEFVLIIIIKLVYLLTYNMCRTVKAMLAVYVLPAYTSLL